MSREKELVERIDALRAEIAQYQETIHMAFAVLTAAVVKTGPITITQEEINDVLRSGNFVIAETPKGKMEYTLHMPEDAAEDK